MITKKALHKYKALIFWEKYGIKATIDAYGVVEIDTIVKFVYGVRSYVIAFIDVYSKTPQNCKTGWTYTRA